MARKNKNNPVGLKRAPNGSIQLLVDSSIVPQWKEPRKAKSVTLQEFALDADSYPMCCYDIPVGQRVIVMGMGIFDINGQRLVTPDYSTDQFTKLFFPVISAAYNHNAVLDSVIRYNGNYGTSELILCDCFCGQDWNSSKIMMPINLRRQALAGLIEDANEIFYKKMKYVKNVNKNFRAVSDVWVFNIRDVIAEYTLLSYKKDATGLLLIDAKQTNPHDAYYEDISGGTPMPFRFKEQERSWKILVQKRSQEKPAPVKKTVIKSSAVKKSSKKHKI